MPFSTIINQLPRVALLLLLCFTVQAQDKIKTIGNKPRTGSSNSSFPVVKGRQVGIKMNAGSKPVQLLKLSFSTDNRNRDSLAFKVNVYEFNGKTPGNNLVTPHITGYIPKGKNRVNVDLAPYHLTAQGHILVAIEWLNTHNGSEPYFAIGLFNGGTYLYKNNTWEKMPVAGVDFNVEVKKLK
jgi:hypothetical protein